MKFQKELGLNCRYDGENNYSKEIITKDGRDVTKQYKKGAEECLFLAKKCR